LTKPSSNVDTRRPPPRMTELEALANGPISLFRDWPNQEVPLLSAGVYTIWDGAQLIYAGMAGRSLTRETILAGRQTTLVKGLRQRLASHASGRRSGDQFCVYVADRLVLGTLSPAEIAQIAAGELSLDARIRRYIHEHLAYRWVEMPDGASAYVLEAQICRGGLPAGLPLLNPRGAAV
jgi:hypothetical protein